MLDHVIPHLHRRIDQAEGPKSRLPRTAMMVLAVTLHNIPEGMAAWLCDLYGLDGKTDVIRHYDVIGKECPRYFVQHEDAWAKFKADVAHAQE